jgi:hypothetical protein
MNISLFLLIEILLVIPISSHLYYNTEMTNFTNLLALIDVELIYFIYLELKSINQK